MIRLCKAANMSSLPIAKDLFFAHIMIVVLGYVVPLALNFRGRLVDSCMTNFVYYMMSPGYIPTCVNATYMHLAMVSGLLMKKEDVPLLE